MLGIKNEYAFMYEEEIRKHNVDTPTFDEEEIDEEDIESFEEIETPDIKENVSDIKGGVL